MRLKVAYNYWRHTIHFSGGGVVQQRPLIHCHPPYPFMRADFYKMKDRQRTPMVYVYTYFLNSSMTLMFALVIYTQYCGQWALFL